jgi:UDP-N-acetylglucosamine 2-epimerase (hydrolysing)
MGEFNKHIFVIGSPDIDIMFSENLPTVNEALSYYGIPFDNYNILMFHPVTTENNIGLYATNLAEAVLEDNGNYIIIKPNNDMGSAKVNKALSIFENNPRFIVFPSLRFEFFLALLKHSNLIIGNSSAGVREAPLYGVTSIDVGNRQLNRVKASSIIHASYEKEDIKKAIDISKDKTPSISQLFGKGNSDKLFLDILNSEKLWNISCQKQFKDRKMKD